MFAGLCSWPCHKRCSGVVWVWGWSQRYSSCTSSHEKLAPVQEQLHPGPSTTSHGPVDTCNANYSAISQEWWHFDIQLADITRHSKLLPLVFDRQKIFAWWILPHCRVHQMCRGPRHGLLWLDSACGTSPPALQPSWGTVRDTHTLQSGVRQQSSRSKTVSFINKSALFIVLFWL